ncbi:unnamed protein product [Lactuca saligna]|uniref:Uncharacterized protein n=1 Tax=Lactuca saligna TaxID=75948 RepID=A0AA35ZM31_LACSI|nr:unnamed protein product [Lactuca saligna]
MVLNLEAGRVLVYCQGFYDMVISLDNMVDRLSDVKLQPTKDKVVKANEVLAAGHQPCPIMETIIVTLLYLALHSEKIELEGCFYDLCYCCYRFLPEGVGCCCEDATSPKLKSGKTPHP